MSMGINLITQGWLVLEMTNDPLWVGLLAGVAGISQVTFGFISGVIVDRWNKRIIILVVQLCTGFIGLTVALLLFFNNSCLIGLSFK